MSSPLFERVRGIAADVLQVAATQLTLESSTENVDSWDSVHHLNLVLALEQEFDLQFEPEEMDQMHSISHIVNVLENKLNHRAS
jgi:acyl carrier protein